MKKQLLTAFIFSLLSTSAFAQGQQEMNQDAATTYKLAEKEINSVYQSILKEYSTDQVFLQNLKVAQRLWIQFRDAEVKAKFPDREPGYYGSVHSMCVADYMTMLTRKRIAELRVWLDGIEEGDVCAGSVKIK